MRICIICEGSYPYVTGGVSAWVQMLISRMPEYEFIIYCIGAFEDNRGKFKYKLPDNVIQVEEVFLDQIYKIEVSEKIQRVSLQEEYKQAFKQLVLGGQLDWKLLIEFMRKIKVKNAAEFFMSREFFQVLTEVCTEKYSEIPFTDFFWTMRSMLLPLIFLARQEVPKADLYHSVSAGYGGIIGAVGNLVYDKPYVLTEHGIYAREREEEIIKAGWVKGNFKDDWIQFFHHIADCSYNIASKVVTLFGNNRQIEMDLGCGSNKIRIIPNGVDIASYQGLPQKEEENMINIGIVARVVPIKDIKTLISAFSLVKEKVPNARLYIMGPMDEAPSYYQECLEMIKYLSIQDIIFTGSIQVKDYIGKMDILVISSVSEGQPLAVLEGMAAHKPFVSTNVGSCSELLYGREDRIGKAGLVVPVMNDTKMAEAIIFLCEHPKIRSEMGENGYLRVCREYTLQKFIDSYRALYQEVGGI